MISFHICDIVFPGQRLDLSLMTALEHDLLFCLTTLPTVPGC